MKKFVRYQNQIISVDGKFKDSVAGAFCWKDKHGYSVATIKDWTYNSEGYALTELIDEMEFAISRAKDRLYEIEGFEDD